MEEQTLATRYRLIEEIGRGGMGIVYRAYDRLHNRDVALKQVTAIVDTPGKQRSVIMAHGAALTREFRTLAGLHHPNIVSVLDYGFDRYQIPFFTMTLIDDALSLRNDRLFSAQSQLEKTEILLQILQALHYLHRRGIIHRDLKPGNILAQGRHIFLLDFGLALDVDREILPDLPAGTLQYLAPELLHGASPSVSSDLYAFGIIAHEIFTGHHPLEAYSRSDLLDHILYHPIDLDPNLFEPELHRILQRLLSRDPQERYHSALDVIRELCAALSIPIPPETSEIRDSFLKTARFVGREQEFQMLSKASEAMLNGHGSAWLIGGESGVGKTRLMDEIRVEALVNGVLVIRGQAISEGGVPYQLWRDVLPYLLLLQEVSLDDAQIFRPLVPNIDQLLEWDVTVPAPQESEIEAARLSLALLELISVITEQQPLLILLEDLQWAEESIDLLKPLLALAKNRRLMILANYRSDERPDLAAELGEMEHLSLGRLQESDVQQLSTSMLGDIGNSPNLMELLYRETEGNAFFIVEVIRSLAEDAGELEKIGRVTLPGQILAGGIDRVAKQRIDHLPTWARPTIALAAVAGRTLNAPLLQHIEPTLDWAAWYSVCSDAAILAFEGGRWIFSHDKIREYILRTLEEDKKRSLHQQVAGAIKVVFASSIVDQASLLTLHYGLAGNHEQEARYAAMASFPALEYSPKDALIYAQRALELHEYDLHEQPIHQQAHLLYVAGRAAVRISEYELARRYLLQSRDLFSRIDAQLQAAMANNVLGEIGMMIGEYQDAIPRIEESLKIFLQEDNKMETFAALTNLAIIYANEGEIEQAAEYFQRCVDVISGVDNPIELSKALNNLAVISDMRGESDKSRSLHEEALQLRRKIHDQPGIASSLSNLAQAELRAGNHQRATEFIEESVRILRATGGRRNLAGALNIRAACYLASGNPELALSQYQEALDICNQIGIKRLASTTYINIADIHLSQKEFTLAQESTLAALRLAQELDLMPSLLHSILMLARIDREQGRYVQALRLYGLISTHLQYLGQTVDMDAELEQMKKSLPDSVFDRLISVGKQLDLNDEITRIITEQSSMTESE